MAVIFDLILGWPLNVNNCFNEFVVLNLVKNEVPGIEK